MARAVARPSTAVSLTCALLLICAPLGAQVQPPRQSVGEVVGLPDTLGQEQTVKVFTQGRGTIYAGNVEKAREAALRQAYSEAVAVGAGISVGSLTLLTNVKKVCDVVVSRSRGFVKTYEVISEGIVDGSTYQIRIGAEVVTQGVSEEAEIEGLRLYLEVLGHPKLLIMLPRYDMTASAVGAAGSSGETGTGTGASDIAISEAGAPAGIFRGTEAAIAQAFSKYGYQVQTTDDLASSGLVPHDVLDRARKGVTEDVVTVARAANADLALFGVMRVSSQKVSPYGVDFISVTGEASAKAMIVSSGYLVEAFHTTKTKAHPNPLGASSAVLDSIAEDFAQTLAWKIPSTLVKNPRESRLVLDGVTLDEAEKVKQALVDLPEVDAVRFVTLPTMQNREKAELLVLTGFVRIDENELYRAAAEAVPKTSARKCAFELVSSDKYQIRLNRCGSVTL